MENVVKHYQLHIPLIITMVTYVHVSVTESTTLWMKPQLDIMLRMAYQTSHPTVFSEREKRLK